MDILTCLSKIIEHIPPTDITLILVIGFLCWLLDRKDKLLKELGDSVNKNSLVTKEFSTLLRVLVTGRRE